MGLDYAQQELYRKIGRLDVVRQQIEQRLKSKNKPLTQDIDWLVINAKLEAYRDAYNLIDGEIHEKDFKVSTT